MVSEYEKEEEEEGEEKFYLTIYLFVYLFIDDCVILKPLCRVCHVVNQRKVGR